MIKRIIALAFAALTSLAALTVGSFALPRLRGDANGDGKLNARDAVEIMKLIANGDENVPELADYDGDGALNAKDVTDLMKLLVGYHTENDELLELKYGVSAPDFEVPDIVTERTVSSAEFGFSESADDNCGAFSAAVSYLSANPGTTLKFETGTYRMGKSWMILTGLKNCVIDGNGSRFLYSDRNYFRIRQCEGLKFTNLTFDWDWSAYHVASLMRVKSFRGGVAEFEFFEEQDASYALTNNWLAMMRLDPEDLSPCVPGSGDWPGDEPYVKNRTLTEPNVITAFAPDLPLNEGEVYLIKHFQYSREAFTLEGGSSNLVFENVAIHSGPTSGFIMQEKVHHIRLTNVQIEPDPDEFRRYPISTTDDALHIKDTLGYIIMENCSVGYCYDDFLNIHDNCGYVKSAEGSVLRMHACNTSAFTVGDTLSFRSQKDFTDLGVTAKILSRTYVSDPHEYVLTMDRDVSSLAYGNIVHDESTDTSNVIIRDCYFHQGRSRVLLGASDCVLEGCRFYKTQLIPILIPIGISVGSVAEGTGVDNLIIRNNVFEDCNAKHNVEGSMIAFEATDEVNSNKRLLGECFKNVMIARNLFINPSGAAVYATCVKNLTVFGNTIECTREPWVNVSASAVGKIYVRGKYFDGTSIVANCWLASEFFPARVNDVSMPSGSGSYLIEDNKVK